MSTRVVSKRTKLLFIGFGAAGIAAVCIVCATGPRSASAASAKTTPAAVESSK